jgi:Holliday junction resolvase RusA-like endonuclease
MHIGMAAKEAMKAAPTPLSGPLELEVIFYMPRPKRLPKGAEGVPHICRPDTDNLLKSTQDALQMASVVSDDSCFYKVSGAKYYADYGTPARAVIRIILAEEALEG